MARVTVEDCVEKVQNRFELVAFAAQRSREISAGSDIRVERDNDKNPVVALREIADDHADAGELKESLVQSMQKHVEIDEPEEDGFDTIGLPSAEGVDQDAEAAYAQADGMSVNNASDAAAEDQAAAQNLYEDVVADD